MCNGKWKISNRIILSYDAYTGSCGARSTADDNPTQKKTAGKITYSILLVQHEAIPVNLFMWRCMEKKLPVLSLTSVFGVGDFRDEGSEFRVFLLNGIDNLHLEVDWFIQIFQETRPNRRKADGLRRSPEDHLELDAIEIFLDQSKLVYPLNLPQDKVNSPRRTGVAAGKADDVGFSSQGVVDQRQGAAA